MKESPCLVAKEHHQSEPFLLKLLWPLALSRAQIEEGMGAREEDLAKDMPKLGNPTSRGVLQNGGQVEGYEVSCQIPCCCALLPWCLK